jgi:hypothetical protein
VLLFASLACNAPIIGNDDPEGGDEYAPSAPSTLTTVGVSPASGTGSFTVSVNYFWNLADAQFAITCTYPGPDGTPVSAPAALTHEAYTASFAISVTKPGDYSVNCQDTSANSASALFTVTSPPDAVEPTATEVDKPKFTQAMLYIDTALTSFTATTGDAINIFICQPSNWSGIPDFSFTVSEQGALNGACKQQPYFYHTTSGILTGQWDQSTDTVSFELVVNSLIYGTGAGETLLADKTAIWAVVIKSLSGSMIDEDTAQGQASWTNTCDAHPDISCYDLTNHKYSEGTVNWTIEFRP